MKLVGQMTLRKYLVVRGHIIIINKKRMCLKWLLDGVYYVISFKTQGKWAVVYEDVVKGLYVCAL